MVLTPSEDVQRVKADPTLGPQVVEIPQLAITYYDFNNGIDPKTLKPFAALRGPKTCPTMNKDFRIALTAGHRQEGLHRRDVRRHRPDRQQLRHAGHPGLPGRPRPVSVRPRRRPRRTWTTALAALGVASAADLGKLKFGFNSGAGHEPRVAFLAEAWRQAFGLETEQIGSDFSVFLTAAHGR